MNRKLQLLSVTDPDNSTNKTSEGKTHAYERMIVMKDAVALKNYYGLNETYSGVQNLRVH